MTNEDNNEDLIIFFFYLPEKSKLCIVFLLTESTARAVLAITAPLNKNHLSATTVLNPTRAQAFFQITHWKIAAFSSPYDVTFNVCKQTIGPLIFDVSVLVLISTKYYFLQFQRANA